MTGARLYRLSYLVMRIFHWCLFFIVVEIIFCIAGWMIFGILGNIASWVTYQISGEDFSDEFSRYFQFTGKAVGFCAGLAAMWFVMARYRHKSEREFRIPARFSARGYEPRWHGTIESDANDTEVKIMSMVCTLRQADAAEIQALIDNPDELDDFFEGDSGVDGDELRPDMYYLDKAWHGIHYLLTGSAWEGEPPLCFLLAGGQEIGDEEFGYAVPRAWSPRDVSTLDDALAQVAGGDLAKRFNPRQMLKDEIYPEIWDRNPKDDDTLGYLLDYYEGLREFVGKSRDAGKGLVVFLT